MDQKEFEQKIDSFIEEWWPTIQNDIAQLVAIPSVENLEEAAPGAPFGPEPKKALEKALAIAQNLGFETKDMEGYAGYADFKGTTDTQLGIIGHVDVVPAGPGWDTDPFQMEVRDGYLLGRGVLDDKGPSMVMLYAMKFWKDQGIEFPYTIRFIFGCNEETDLLDVEYYRKHEADPAFIITPDAEFPVCYGEKGGYNATITSGEITDGIIVDFEGGVATNAVPGQATALIRADVEEMEPADRLTFTQEGTSMVRIDAHGESAHAAMPEKGINAIGLIVDYLLEHNLCNEQERAFLEFDQALLSHTDGSGIGIATSDEYFGPLTVIGGTICRDGDRFAQTLDSRWPTSITPDEITKTLTQQVEKFGGTVEVTMILDTFLVDPEDPTIQTLMDAYVEVTGDTEHKPFTIGGGTYAREFTKGSSFGPEKTWIEYPDWAGGMHGPNEAMAIDQLKEALKIYALALYNLEQLDLS